MGAALIACGDNSAPASSEAALGPAADLVIVAHQDDDLLFMQPDISDLVRAHAPLAIVYVTAGDAGAGLGYADSRVVAVEAAYAAVAGRDVAEWRCAALELAGHVAQHCRLDAAAVSLIFLGYPDGGIDGSAPTSMLRLWEGEIEGADTIAHQVSHYDQQGLVDVVARIIETTAPRLIHTLDIAAIHGEDHADHTIVGALAMVARARAGSTASLLAYRGYNDRAEPANLTPEIAAGAGLAFRAYEACQVGCGVCGQVACEESELLGRYVDWLHRRYAVAIRREVLGRFALRGRCLVPRDDASVGLGDCDGAPELWLDPTGLLHVGDGCLGVGGDHQLAVGDCAIDPAHNFAIDDEGHVWSGVLPPPSRDMRQDHGMCLKSRNDVVSVGRCGAHRNPRWSVLPRATTMHVALAGRGRALQLGVLDRAAALCDVEHGALTCVARLDVGGPGATTSQLARGPAFDIYPESLVLADVDGDGRGDACGRSATGVVCATAASGFRAAPWSGTFAGPATAGDRTFAALELDGKRGAELCAIDDQRVACASPGRADPTVVTTLGAPGGALMSGDLDGDGRPDWCATTGRGPVCALAADRPLGSAPTAWGFSWSGVVEGAARPGDVLAAPEQAALIDVDGDGRADLCTLTDDRVDCAVSQGHGFGPRTTVLVAPAGFHPSDLWTRTIDGVAELCIDIDARDAFSCVLLGAPDAAEPAESD